MRPQRFSLARDLMSSPNIFSQRQQGVDEAAYVKAAFLSAVAKGEATSPIISPTHAAELLSTMQG